MFRQLSVAVMIAITHNTVQLTKFPVAITIHQLTQASLESSSSLDWLCTLSILLLRTCFTAS